jgi:hypothetical protein
MMATGATISHELALIGTFAREMGQRLGTAVAERAPGVFDSYHPELHYMRGPGPKWREKHGLAARKKHAWVTAPPSRAVHESDFHGGQ